MNALDLLRNDHTRIARLLRQLNDEPDPVAGQTSADKLEHVTRAIRFHIQMLNEYLFPELDAFGETSNLLAAQTDITRSIKQLIAALEDNQPPEPGRTERIGRLSEAWQEHIEQSEQNMFPEAERLLGATRLQQLQYDMDSIRTRQSDQDSAIYPASRLGPKT